MLWKQAKHSFGEVAQRETKVELWSIKGIQLLNVLDRGSSLLLTIELQS